MLIKHLCYYKLATQLTVIEGNGTFTSAVFFFFLFLLIFFLSVAVCIKALFPILLHFGCCTLWQYFTLIISSPIPSDWPRHRWKSAIIIKDVLFSAHSSSSRTSSLSFPLAVSTHSHCNGNSDGVISNIIMTKRGWFALACGCSLLVMVMVLEQLSSFFCILLLCLSILCNQQQHHQQLFLFRNSFLLLSFIPQISLQASTDNNYSNKNSNNNSNKVLYLLAAF